MSQKRFILGEKIGLVDGAGGVWYKEEHLGIVDPSGDYGSGVRKWRLREN